MNILVYFYKNVFLIKKLLITYFIFIIYFNVRADCQLCDCCCGNKNNSNNSNNSNNKPLFSPKLNQLVNSNEKDEYLKLKKEEESGQEEEKKIQEEVDRKKQEEDEEINKKLKDEERKKKEEEEKRLREEEQKRKKIEEEEKERIQKNNKPELLNNRYRLEKENIGKGGYGTVSKYFDITDKKTVAIKIISEKHKGMQECEILKLLKGNPHVNIVEIKDIFEDDANMFFVEEFCEYDLITYYNAHKVKEREYRFTDEERMCLFYQIINGLEFLHKLNISYGDLKFQNFLVTKEGILKICDFGECYHCGQKGEYISFKRGTPGSMAPEIYNRKNYDPFKADIWSCGLILWAMFNFSPIVRLPKVGSEITTFDDFYERYKNIKFDDLKNCENELCKDLVFKMLTFDPKKRISIDEIKKHELYIKGKKKFIEKYPEKFKEIDDKII